MRIAALSLLLTFPIVAFSTERWQIETRPAVTRLCGVVIALDDKPLADVSVEIFEHPELPLDPKKNTESMARRAIASTVTQADGKFSIASLRPGKYELRFTKHEFDTLSVIVTLFPKKKGASKRPMRIAMRTAA